MKVYVLSIIDYDDFEVIGIYANNQKAYKDREIIAQLRHDTHRKDRYHVDEMEVIEGAD